MLINQKICDIFAVTRIKQYDLISNEGKILVFRQNVQYLRARAPLRGEGLPGDLCGGD